MALTTCQITHTFKNSDGSAGSGSVDFKLSKRITNGTVSVLPGTVINVPLDGTGAISASLYSNADTATIPTDSQYLVTFRLAGASEEEFAIVVPATAGPVDLGSLLPQNTTGG